MVVTMTASGASVGCARARPGKRGSSAQPAKNMTGRHVPQDKFGVTHRLLDRWIRGSADAVTQPAAPRLFRIFRYGSAGPSFPLRDGWRSDVDL